MGGAGPKINKGHCHKTEEIHLKGLAKKPYKLINILRCTYTKTMVTKNINLCWSPLVSSAPQWFPVASVDVSWSPVICSGVQ